MSSSGRSILLQLLLLAILGTSLYFTEAWAAYSYGPDTDPRPEAWLVRCGTAMLVGTVAYAISTRRHLILLRGVGLVLCGAIVGMFLKPWVVVGSPGYGVVVYQAYWVLTGLFVVYLVTMALSPIARALTTKWRRWSVRPRPRSRQVSRSGGGRSS